MAEKKPFVLRVNPDMLKEIEAWANDEFRSTNGQIEYLLQQALNERKKKKKNDRWFLGDLFDYADAWHLSFCIERLYINEIMEIKKNQRSMVNFAHQLFVSWKK